ncbi:phosphodiester glycosidase family protein (plasmid) [Rhizobium sullae]|uniref:Phosphodiester glycosidase family protein n=1 Tax=Rhizobium sullae TaxID=50338 RepID=A0ABY5XSZ3_RHISU|nr:phosphodiester glycosidase family protein [Rhizobium sullae]UWU17765.1 phosphodiester glycosidase family protein [Rhizobium sullae]
MTYLKNGVLFAVMMLVALITPLPPALAQDCGQETFQDARYIVCTVEPGKADLRLFWNDVNGEPYRYFSRVAEAVGKEGRALTFAMNAGMYRADFSPIGLYVENGRELRPANTAGGEGSAGLLPNFYKKPNGVFFLDDAGAGILPTDQFLKLRPKVRFATQSGPLLVMQNKLHPAFILGSTDRTRRSGVGVCGGGTVRFAASDDTVNFHEFARLFRDHFKCPNALFLDGGRGVGIYNPAMGRNDRSWHGGFGPIFGVVE